jgi:hypothetical protein
MRGFAALEAAFKRRIEAERVYAPRFAVLRATDFLTGSPTPSFARAAGPNGALIADIEREADETYEAFETRAITVAADRGAKRVVLGGIPTIIPEEIVSEPPGARAKGVGLIDHCLHADQIRALRLIKQRRFVVLRNGRRWGKTRLIEALIVDAALMGMEIGYFAPVYALTSPTVANLAAILEPVASVINRSSQPRLIALPGGGLVELWSLDNARVGRSRRYDFVCLDEAAYVEGDMNLIFDASITPCLLDRKGSALAASTPAGVDETKWFWRINNIDELGFARFHAKSADNPFMPADELERLRVSHNPAVFQQEYEGEFVDLSGVSLFDINKMLVNGQPLDTSGLDEHFDDERAWSAHPKLYDAVFMTVDCTMKGGPEGDANAFLICAFNQNYVDLPRGMIILEWFASEAGELDVDQEFRFVVDRFIKYARRARVGSRGIFVEDTGLGSHLIRAHAGLGVEAFDSGWVALGKNPRVMAAIPYVNRGQVKITRSVYEKRVVLKNTLANHFRIQLLNYRANDPKARSRADDLVDVTTAAIITAWNLASPT